MDISDIEIGALLNFFNRGGYVLDFSTCDFDYFTYQIVGKSLCQEYGLSKGKSLTAFVREASKEESIKLFNALMRHYELSSMKEDDEQHNKRYADAYKKCKEILSKVQDNTIVSEAALQLKKEFNSQYISAQIDIMVKMQEENPTEAIGKSKELIESCCKTILETENCTIDTKWDITRLVDETFKFFHIMPKDIPNEVKGAKSIKQILGSLKALVQGVTELRNLYGAGHGKASGFKGLEPRHAKLAVGSSIMLTQFLWDSYDRYKQRNKN